MYTKITLLTALSAATLLADGRKNVSLHIPDEVSPPGGMVQMKMMVTEPTPIATGSVGFSFDPDTFDGVRGISLFNPNGDVNGAAVVEGNHVHLRYTTTTGTTGKDYPIMSVALAVRGDAAVGQKTQFALDPTSVWLLDLFGPATLKPIAPATITVGGSISITDVTPGGGIMHAGSILTIHGIGFQPKTQVQVSGVKLSSINIVSPAQIDLTIAETVQITGKKIHVVNPDGSQDFYFSYMRGVALGSSTQPLLAATTPVFSSHTHSQATFVVAPCRTGQFNGLAIQNPNQADASITLASYGASGALLDQVTLDLPAGMKITRDVLEWMPKSAHAAFVDVSSTAPIQVFALWGDPASSTVLPFRPVAAKP
jgi:hypothetical protein